MNFLQNLQNKSDVQKKKVLIICLAVLMFLVVLLWIFQMKNYSLPVKDETLLSPISEIKDNAVDMYNDSADKIKDIKESIGDM